MHHGTLITIGESILCIFVRDVNLHKNIYEVYDLWEHVVIGKTNMNLTKNIPAHGACMVRLSETDL